jgi:hypothetical protein
MNGEELIKKVRKQFPSKLLKTGVIDTDDNVFIPLSLLSEVLKLVKKKPKKEAPRYFKEFFVAYSEWYLRQAWNTKGITPQINNNASERNALWNIMGQVEELHNQKAKPEDYTPEKATAMFTALLNAAANHKFLKDKVSLSLTNKYFNELIADVVKSGNLNNTESYFNNFEHIYNHTETNTSTESKQ